MIWYKRWEKDNWIIQVRYSWTRGGTNRADGWEWQVSVKQSRNSRFFENPHQAFDSATWNGIVEMKGDAVPTPFIILEEFFKQLKEQTHSGWNIVIVDECKEENLK